MNEDERVCDSRFRTMYSMELVKCELLGRHPIHQGYVKGETIIWRPDQEYREWINTEKPKSMKKDKATDKQVGGDHYKNGKMQVFDVWDAFGLDPYEANAVKYLLRHRKKNGKEDLEKAIHYIQVIMEKNYDV